MLLQQRAFGKTTFPGIWSNACCSHPLVTDSDLHSAMQRKLNDELGIPQSALDREDFTFLGKIRYSALSKTNPSWGEHELDHIYAIVKDVEIDPNEGEISDTRWVGASELQDEMGERPGDFAPWFKACVRDIFLDKSIWKHISNNRLAVGLDHGTICYDKPLE